MNTLYGTIMGIAKYYEVSPLDVLSFDGIATTQLSVKNIIYSRLSSFNKFNNEDMLRTTPSDLSKYVSIKSLSEQSPIDELVYFICMREYKLVKCTSRQYSTIDAIIHIRNLKWIRLNDDVYYVELTSEMKNSNILKELESVGAMFKTINKIFVRITRLIPFGISPKKQYDNTSKATETTENTERLMLENTSTTNTSTTNTSTTNASKTTIDTIDDSSDLTPSDGQNKSTDRYECRGGCYLIMLAHESSKKGSICKIGKTYKFLQREKAKEYRNCREIAKFGMSDYDTDLCEKELIEAFNKLFTNVAKSKDSGSIAFGKEYFEGDEYLMIKLFISICMKYVRAELS